MRQTQRLDEMEFELALIGALEDLYGVNVRVHDDPLNRRTQPVESRADDVPHRRRCRR